MKVRPVKCIFEFSYFEKVAPNSQRPKLSRTIKPRHVGCTPESSYIQNLNVSSPLGQFGFS